MTLQLPSAIAVLERTPDVLDALLRNLPHEWVAADEGPDTWNAFDIVGHLVHGERTDWIPRAETILRHGERQPFKPFDRFAQFRDSDGKTLTDLLDEFRHLRAGNVRTIQSWQLSDADLSRTGVHPEFGQVTLSQLIATWVTHDLSHLGQIARIMAKRYGSDVGPWKAYLRILHT